MVLENVDHAISLIRHYQIKQLFIYWQAKYYANKKLYESQKQQ